MIVESLGLWTAFSVSLLRHIAAHTTFRSGVSPGIAFCNLLQQLSVKLWSYNAKMILRFISLLPDNGVEDSFLNYFPVVPPSSVCGNHDIRESVVSDASSHEVTHADFDSDVPGNSVSDGAEVSICFSTPHGNVSSLPSPDVCSSSFTPPSSALCLPGCSDDVLYSVSVTNRFSSLMDEHDQSSDEGLSPFMGDHNQSSVKGLSPAVSNKGLENPSAASSRTLRKRRGRCSGQENHHSCTKDMDVVSMHDEGHEGSISITTYVCLS